MSDLFISYASDDREYVAKLVSVFEAQGWTVWWDRHIKTGVSFDRMIEEALDDARCVVVVWSEASLHSDWVRAEAAEGLERNILVPILLDDVRPPLLFRQKQAISLVEWKAQSNRIDVLSDLMPSIASILKSYAESALPVSTQKSWVLAPVANLTSAPRLGGAAQQVLSIGMTYFDDAFLYQADDEASEAGELTVEQVETIVENEGLNGLISCQISGDEGDLLLRLTLEERGVETVVRECAVADEADFVTALVGLLVDMARDIQGSELTHAERLHAYMADLTVDGLNCFAESFLAAKKNDYQQTKLLCEQAIELSGDFIPAYRGLAIACLYLGQFAEARQTMLRAMREMKNESDRNQHFARGMYHVVFSEEHDKGAAEFEAIMKMSPLDNAAINNLAVCRFYQLRFKEASELAARDLQLYPGKILGLQNAAFYSMYAGDFQRAEERARQVLERDAAYVRSNVIRALVEAERGDIEAAEAVYRAALCGKAEQDSILYQGLADLAIAKGDLAEALAHLETGLVLDEEAANPELRANKLLMQLECELSQGEVDDQRLRGRIGEVFELSDSVAVVITVALIGFRFGKPTPELALEVMKKKVNLHGRAYVRVIEAMIEASNGNLGESVAKLGEANNLADLWLIRFCASFINERAGLVLEASDDLQACLARPGEAISGALDELPTFRYLALLRAAA